MQKKQRKTFFQSNSAMKPLVSGNHVFLIECHIKSLGRHSQACPAFCHKAIVNDRLVAKATGIHHCKHHAWWQLRRRLCCVQYAGDKGLQSVALECGKPQMRRRDALSRHLLVEGNEDLQVINWDNEVTSISDNQKQPVLPGQRLALSQ